MKLPKFKNIKTEMYIAGPSSFKKKIAKIKLSANESALGPSPKAVREYNKVSKNFKRYPDPDGVSLRKILGKKFKLDPNRIILGSGSDQIFEIICKAFINKNDEVIVPQYSFIIYRMYSKISGAKIIYAKEKKFRVSIDNILSCVTKKTKVVFLANPNNPTGTCIGKKDLIRLRRKLRSNILLVIDDAYFEYVNEKDYSSGLKLFSKSKNVVVTRTFSKIYGLAGLRVGWGYSSMRIINVLNQLKPPFNVSRPALFAASAAVADTTWLKKRSKQENINQNEYMKEKKVVSVKTVDNYALDKKIKFIDILKIDTQGYENKVLEGSKNLLENKKIHYIQLELIFSKYGR